MALNLAAKVVGLLKARPEQHFTAREMALWIFEKHPAECAEKRTKSTFIDSDAALIQQLVAEIGGQRPAMQKANPEIKTSEGRPRKYFWTEASDQLAVSNAEATGDALGVAAGQWRTTTEAELYPLLSVFVWSEFQVYSQRIDERRGSNTRGSGGNRWLYPDVVGMEDLTADWDPEIRQIVKEYADKKTQLYSFEVKLLLNRSNVRECYFQTVSNSSWANIGYLVASRVEGTDTIKELRMLFGLHGLGLIELDIDNPTESQILIPARERAEVDWVSCNRLAKENSDFLNYVARIRQFHQTGDPRASDWNLPREA